MKDLGYTRQFSQDDKGHSFDGLYYHGTPDEEKSSLFITESKCRDEDVSAETYMENELDDMTLFKRLEASSYHSASNLVDVFMVSAPENIFKLVHRIKADGTSQSGVLS